MLEEAVKIILDAQHVTAFSDAGISVESGIPPFRGENGLWNKFDPVFLNIDYFHKRPFESWKLIRQVSYDFIWKAQPNSAHFALAEMEQSGNLSCVVTQNIDSLHYCAGSRNVVEFHGTSRNLVCLNCSRLVPADTVNLNHLPPECRKCGGVLKPDFVFFGEQIPEPAATDSFRGIRYPNTVQYHDKPAEIFTDAYLTGELDQREQSMAIETEKGLTLIVECGTPGWRAS
jgi:NAD-dependent deacetylase